ncbi:MAG: glycosyltransferase [Candidatus Aenigmatarchaeota archaeon]
MLIEYLLIAITIILIIIYSSWIALLLIPKKKIKGKFFSPISIIIPAYNEEENIASTLESVLNAKYPNKREIIVVDDGSKDRTAEIVRKFAKKNKNIKLIKGRHQGKAKAVNLALKYSKFGVIVVLDADTKIEKDALIKIVQPLKDEKIGGVASVLRVQRSKNFLSWLQSFDYAVVSGWKKVCEKVNGLCILPGFCAFRKSAIKKIGGFKGDTPVEDFDISFYLRNAGFEIRMADAVAYTKVPQTLRGFIRQRIRWIRGTLQVVKKHNKLLFSKKYIGVSFFSVPTQLYWYFHSFLYLPLTLYQIVNGYLIYFVAYGNFFSFEVVKYFLNWFTIFGMLELIYKTFIGIYVLTPFLLLTIVVFSLSIIFNLYSLFKFSERSIYNIIAFVLFCPYVLIVLSTYWIGNLFEIYERRNFSKWEKCK